jgi:hypothetical protein
VRPRCRDRSTSHALVSPQQGGAEYFGCKNIDELCKDLAPYRVTRDSAGTVIREILEAMNRQKDKDYTMVPSGVKVSTEGLVYQSVHSICTDGTNEKYRTEAKNYFAWRETVIDALGSRTTGLER